MEVKGLSKAHQQSELSEYGANVHLDQAKEELMIARESEVEKERRWREMEERAEEEHKAVTQSLSTFSPHNDGGKTPRFRVLHFGPGRLAIGPRNACTQSHVTPPRLAKSLGYNATKENCTSHSSSPAPHP